ncbi:hypothetical protein OG864_45185 [Streptomyces sp. NBC_00124]|uniref:hypothetical protein n=1 Tax=Streptomyces sp. NBC_00124 TaxID=2975662 RepID=UPI00225BF6DE|nr:hypothetical protein [Streptomyces sp. NBC_00124]MCX5365897.1 hypothetical protein [Streptomyces sp. NBC_00124]
MTDEPEDLTGAWTPDPPIGCLLPGAAPAERCGNWSPAGFAGRTECTLRPGHSGSHADDSGARWTWDGPPEAADAPRSVPQASGGELTGRNSGSGAQAASSASLRERLVESLDHYPVACWTPRNLAGRVMGVVGAELNQSEKTAREQSARAEAAEQRANHLAATLGTALAAMGLHWAHADFHGPQDAYITPEMFKTWRTALEPQEQP